jgi:hypothetical protein
MWQPIETAPRDGTPILTWGPEFMCPCDNYWLSGGWYEYGEPTHWMPMPEAPIANDNTLMPNDIITLA